MFSTKKQNKNEKVISLEEQVLVCIAFFIYKISTQNIKSYKKLIMYAKKIIFSRYKL